MAVHGRVSWKGRPESSAPSGAALPEIMVLERGLRGDGLRAPGHPDRPRPLARVAPPGRGPLDLEHARDVRAPRRRDLGRRPREPQRHVRRRGAGQRGAARRTARSSGSAAPRSASPSVRRGRRPPRGAARSGPPRTGRSETIRSDGTISSRAPRPRAAREADPYALAFRPVVGAPRVAARRRGGLARRRRADARGARGGGRAALDEGGVVGRLASVGVLALFGSTGAAPGGRRPGAARGAGGARGGAPARGLDLRAAGGRGAVLAGDAGGAAGSRARRARAGGGSRRAARARVARAGEHPRRPGRGGRDRARRGLGARRRRRGEIRDGLRGRLGFRLGRLSTGGASVS